MSRYILEPWQMHAARNGDVVILRAFPNGWDQDGWMVAVIHNGQPRDAGLGDFPTAKAAEKAARQRLGAE